MARPLRLEYEGAIYHVTSRGNAQEHIFLNDRDRARFLEILGDVGCKVRLDLSCLLPYDQPLSPAYRNALS